MRPKLKCILKGQSNSILNISDLFLFISYTPYPEPLRIRKKNKTKQHLPAIIIKIRFKLILKIYNSHAHTIGIIMR